MYLKKVIKVCVLMLAIVGAILSVTAPFYYNSLSNGSLVSFADIKPADTISTSFTGSNVLLYGSVFNTSTVDQSGVYATLPFSTVISLSAGVQSCNFSLMLNSYGLVQQPDLSTISNFYYKYSTTYSLTTFDSWTRLTVDLSAGGYSSIKNVFVSVFISTGFDYSPISARIHTSNNLYGNTSFRASQLDYFDVNGNRFSFTIGYLPNTYLTNLADRTYYLSSDIVPSDNTYYQQGFDYGYSDGLADGLTQGYQTGYNTGFDNGQIVGYQQGSEDAHEYTFLNLMGAVVDAPIQAFIGLLDFNVLGFNMLNLACSLLSVSLIVIVIRFVFFRK